MGGIAVTLGLFFVYRLAYTAHALLQIQCFSLEWPQFMYSIVAISTSFACIRWLKAIRPGFDPSSCEPRKTNWGPISLYRLLPLLLPHDLVFVMSIFPIGRVPRWSMHLQNSINLGRQLCTLRPKQNCTSHACMQTASRYQFSRGMCVCADLHLNWSAVKLQWQ